jgi:hypothetical protein
MKFCFLPLLGIALRDSKPESHISKHQSQPTCPFAAAQTVTEPHSPAQYFKIPRDKMCHANGVTLLREQNGVISRPFIIDSTWRKLSSVVCPSAFFSKKQQPPQIKVFAALHQMSNVVAAN